MNRNPFLALLINYWKSLFAKYDDKVELITRVIARVIVVVFLACLTPTIGVLLSIFYTFDGMLSSTYQKLKETKDEEGKFSILIELAIYFILWLPFVLVYLPLLLLKNILLGCVNNLWVPIVLTVALACGYFYYMGFGNKASVVNTVVNSVQSSYDSVSSDSAKMELSHIEHTTSEESLNRYATNAKSLENDSIEEKILTESFSESKEEIQLYNLDVEQAEVEPEEKQEEEQED